jgi:uncharacterized protein YchJ
MIRAIFRSRYAPFFLANYSWFRQAHGGRLDRWFIGICNSRLWLFIEPNEPDDRYQPCSVGPRLAREDYP